MTVEMSPRERLASNIGIVRMDALVTWAERTAAALGGPVHIYGSALTSKQWRDLDVAVRWRVTPWRGEPMWLLLCAALSRHATDVIGAPVEVHVYAPPSYSEAPISAGVPEGALLLADRHAPEEGS